mmetsp:Transcript_116337/g.329091  ORF Transcript_116337/g.329091 Transcript_116337/m.329091 type:complete len:226 (+) Transcript_116337:574-1251(+)
MPLAFAASTAAMSESAAQPLTASCSTSPCWSSKSKRAAMVACLCALEFTSSPIAADSDDHTAMAGPPPDVSPPKPTLSGCPRAASTICSGQTLLPTVRPKVPSARRKKAIVDPSMSLSRKASAAERTKCITFPSGTQRFSSSLVLPPPNPSLHDALSSKKSSKASSESGCWEETPWPCSSSCANSLSKTSAHARNAETSGTVQVEVGLSGSQPLAWLTWQATCKW